MPLPGVPGWGHDSVPSVDDKANCREGHGGERGEMRSRIRHVTPRWLWVCPLLTVLVLGLPGCGLAARSSQPPPMGYELTRCNGQVVPTRNSAPPAAPPAVYGGAVSRSGGTPQDGAHLYAFSA